MRYSLKVFNGAMLTNNLQRNASGYDRMVALGELPTEPDATVNQAWRYANALDYFYYTHGILGLNTFYRWLKIFHPGVTVDVYTNFKVPERYLH